MHKMKVNLVADFMVLDCTGEGVIGCLVEEPDVGIAMHCHQ